MENFRLHYFKTWTTGIDFILSYVPSIGVTMECFCRVTKDVFWWRIVLEKSTWTCCLLWDCPCVVGHWYLLQSQTHYRDVIMSTVVSPITSLATVYSTVYSRSRSKKAPKLRVTGLCEGNSPVTHEFPAQRASYAENVSIWWRHHADRYRITKVAYLYRPWSTYNSLRRSDAYMSQWKGSSLADVTPVRRQAITSSNGPLTRYVKLQVAHAPGMPGTFSPAADFKGNR